MKHDRENHVLLYTYVLGSGTAFTSKTDAFKANGVLILSTVYGSATMREGHTMGRAYRPRETAWGRSAALVVTV